jgi:predicted nucleic acid-binding Zn ribbon protein
MKVSLMEDKKKPADDFVHIGSVLGNALNKFRADSDLELTSLFTIWNNVVGEAVANNSKPAEFKGKILIVHVSSSVWLQELQYYKKEMITKINNKLGKELVCDIKFRIGTL